MHRREIITKLYPDDDDFCWALKIFWSIYVLDRRWSFGTGMPFAIQDADIDPTLPEPVCSIWFYQAGRNTDSSFRSAPLLILQR